MGDESSKKTKLSWSKKMVRKFFNIKSKCEDSQGDDVVYGGSEVEYGSRNSFSEREPCTIKKSKTEKFSRNSSQVRRGRMNLDHPRIIDVQNYSIFVATWNVAGRSPPSNLNVDDWLHSSPPADIYVLGFQEVVPLNAGNILGAEDNGPAKKWLALIRKTLNNLPGTSGSSGCYTPSPIPQPVVELNADFEGSARQKNSSFFHRRSFQTASSGWGMDNDPSNVQPQVDRRYSVCDRVIFGNRPSDFDPSLRWGYRPSDYSRASDYSRPSDYSRWGSSDDDNGLVDSPSTVLFSPMSTNGGSASNEDGYSMPGHSRYCLVASKQMVGIYLTVWVKGELKDHVRNMKVSCVGRGLMGYLGNKGSISISMSVHETSFCFICSHLTSGQKEGDELRRNSDVLEILKKTRFPRVHGVDNEKSPQTILEHDRIIWLGDLNYRIALSYRSAKALVEMQNWRALLENDQLRIEQKRGRAFVGWNEGKIYFPPTYKYSTNSDRYSGDDMHPKEKRRTPAWCDRILWYGEGLHQLSYVRGESRFSDHRPVYGIFWAEVESTHGKLKKSMSCSGSTKPWENRGRASTDQRDSIKTVEVDTSQPYSYLGTNYRRSHPNYQYNPNHQPQRHSIASPLHRTHQNGSLNQSVTTPSPAKSRPIQVRSSSPRCVREDRSYHHTSQTPSLRSNYHYNGNLYQNSRVGTSNGVSNATPTLPNYMQATESAKARIRSQSAPRQRPSTPERDRSGSVKKRLSFPAPDPYNVGGVGYGNYGHSLRSPSFKSVNVTSHFGLEQHSNYSSCCTESLGGEVSPSSTGDLRRWLR